MRVKRITRAEKAGHAGTLDPLATGLLPVAFGEATKFLQGLLDADKQYLADIRFGLTTTTLDAEGEIVEERPITHDEAMLRECLTRFVGAQDQTPPMFSALKQNGRPLYELARQGIEVERKSRPIVIASIELIDHTDSSARIRVSCSKGTYIRTLAHDIGLALGCGAHLSGLRRERVAGFTLEQALTLEQLEDRVTQNTFEASLLPIDAMVGSMPTYALDEILAARLLQGQRIRIPTTTLTGQVRVYRDLTLLGLGTIQNSVLSPQRLVQASSFTQNSPQNS